MQIHQLIQLLRIFSLRKQLTKDSLKIKVWNHTNMLDQVVQADWMETGTNFYIYGSIYITFKLFYRMKELFFTGNKQYGILIFKDKF